MNDPYDTGTPKYSCAQDIYDALCEMAQTEEMNILSEMGADVSYDNQTYYYTEKATTLQEKFEEVTEYCNNMWILDLAIFQLDQKEIHDVVFDALQNPDLAKRIGFKKLFVEHMLKGDSRKYDEISEAFSEELREMTGWGNYEFIKAFSRAASINGMELYGVTPYPTFAYHLCDKVNGLRLNEEIKLIVACRAHLTSYDDFILGLRMNQALYEQQEQQYQKRVALLKESYEAKVKQLLLIAEKCGIPILVEANGHPAIVALLEPEE